MLDFTALLSGTNGKNADLTSLETGVGTGIFSLKINGKEIDIAQADFSSMLTELQFEQGTGALQKAQLPAAFTGNSFPPGGDEKSPEAVLETISNTLKGLLDSGAGLLSDGGTVAKQAVSMRDSEAGKTLNFSSKSLSIPGLPGHQPGQLAGKGLELLALQPQPADSLESVNLGTGKQLSAAELAQLSATKPHAYNALASDAVKHSLLDKNKADGDVPDLLALNKDKGEKTAGLQQNKIEFARMPPEQIPAGDLKQQVVDAAGGKAFQQAMEKMVASGQSMATSGNGSLPTSSALASSLPTSSELSATMSNLLPSISQSESARSLNAPQQLLPGSEFSQALNARQNFTPGLAMRIQWIYQQALSSAEILMDPPEMGPLSVKVQQNNGETSILFQVSNQQTRELLDESLPKLRQMLEEQGINLGEAAVKQESGQQNKGQGENLSAEKDGAETLDELNESQGYTSGLLDVYS